MNKKNLMDAALYHYGEGRPVISVTRGKVPTVKGWDRWFREPQTEGEVRELFSNSAQGIGLLTFPATDLAALDFDGRHAGEAWALTSIALPQTARNFTRSGGHHLIFRIENGTTLNIGRKVRLVKVDCNCKDRDNGRPKPCGVDFLVNGFFIVPPTPGYSEDADAPFDHIAALPREVIKLAEKSDTRKPNGQATGIEKPTIASGERNSTLTSLAGAMRRRAASKESICAALRKENAAKCSPPLDDTEVRAIAESVARYEPGTDGSAAKNQSASGPKKPLPLVVTMDAIQEQTVSWKWKNRIAGGKLAIFDGDPGIGKSYVTQAIAAAESRGDALPGGEKPSGPGLVLLMSVEDGFGDTVKPHLRMLGADMARIVIPNPARGLAPSLLNAEVIERMVKEVGPSLLIIDPVIAFVGKKDTDKASQVRELLSPLVGMAERYSMAVIIVRHLNKGNAKVLYRGQGSIDFMAACRSAFIIAEDSEEPGRRIMAHVKNSLGPKTPSLSFYIDDKGFRWGEEVAVTAEEVLEANQQGSRERGRAQLDAAQQFLSETLISGAMASNAVKDKALKAGISNATLWRAKEALSIRASKERGTGEWWWRLA